METRIYRITRPMVDDLRREVPLKELALSVNLSSSRLRHLFKDRTGLSPTQYLKSKRLQKAQELLENTFLSVKEIMLRVGFKDKSHFTRDFKKLYGVSPLKYRDQHFARRMRSGFTEDAKTANR